MEDAAAFFGHSQRVGFFGKQDQIRNAFNAQLTSSLTGMNQQQFMQMQEQGAAFGTAVGGSRRLGAQAVTNISQRLGLAVQGDQRLLETIQNVTGQVGDQGIADASGMLANLGFRVAGSAPGRFMLAGFTKFNSDGSLGLDEEIMARHRRGELSMDDIRARGQR